MTENDYIIKNADFYGDDAVDSVATIRQIAKTLGEVSNDLPKYVDFVLYRMNGTDGDPYDIQVFVKDNKEND